MRGEGANRGPPVHAGGFCLEKFDFHEKAAGQISGGLRAQNCVLSKMPVRPGYRRLALASEGSESKLLFHQRNKEVVPAGAHIPYRAISRICRLGWLGKCDSDQARAQQDKTCNGHSEETVRGEFFTHDTPPIAPECWLPSRPIARPARRGRLSRCTVKEISAGSENLNPTDALEQQ
jgi:hypothetical protein